MAFPLSWYVTVETEFRSHLDLPHVIDSHSRQRRTQRFRFRFEAQERAGELAAKTAPELYRYITSKENVARALMRIEDIMPLNSELICSTVEWGSRGAAGKVHGIVTIPAENEVAAMQEP